MDNLIKIISTTLSTLTIVLLVYSLTAINKKTEKVILGYLIFIYILGMISTWV